MDVHVRPNPLVDGRGRPSYKRGKPSDFFKGMATVIVVGLSIGTAFTLFVLPAIYAVFVEQLGMKIEVDEAE